MSAEIEEKGKDLFPEFQDKDEKKMKTLDDELNEIKRKLEALK